MDRSIVMEMATSMIAFTGFLVGLFAIIFYTYQIKRLDSFETIGIAVTYINANLLFLLSLRGLIK